MKRVVGMTGVAVAALILAGCSSGGGASSPASSVGGSAPVKSTGSSTSGSAEATAYLQTRLARPTTIGINTPLKSKPPTGKLIVRLLPQVSIQEEISAASAAAAKVLGWSYKSIPIQNTPNGIQTAFQAAIAMHPAGIEYGGSPVSSFSAQLAEAKADGIAVVGDSTTDKPDTGNGLATMIDGTNAQLQFGKDLAAYVASTSGGPTKVAIFTVSAFPILQPVIDGFTSNLKTWCPGCSTETVNQSLNDIGTTTPQSVVSTVERDPSIKYLLFTFGDLAPGVSQALKVAGLSSKVKIIGSTVSKAALQALRDKTEYAWTGLSPDILAWRSMDSLARVFTGSSLAPANDTLIPSQLITQDNVNTIALDSNGYYIAVPSYQQQFEKLWLLKS